MKCRARNQKRGTSCGTDALHYCWGCRMPLCGVHCRQKIHTRCGREVGALTHDAIRQIAAADAPREMTA